MLLRNNRQIQILTWGLARRLCSTDSSNSPLINQLDKASGVRTLTLNRPKRLNAINRSLYAGLPSALYEASEDADTKIVVITGSGRFFSSGNDLKDFAKSW